MEALSASFRTLLPQQGWNFLSASSASLVALSTVGAIFQACTAPADKKTVLEPVYLLLAGGLGCAAYTYSNLSSPLTEGQLPPLSTLPLPTLSYLTVLGFGLTGISSSKRLDKDFKDIRRLAPALVGLGSLALGLCLWAGTFELPKLSEGVSDPNLLRFVENVEKFWNSSQLSLAGAGVGVLLFCIKPKKTALFLFPTTILAARALNLWAIGR